MLWVKSESICLFVSEPLRLNTSPIAYNACHGECGMRHVVVQCRSCKSTVINLYLILKTMRL